MSNGIFLKTSTGNTEFQTDVCQTRTYQIPLVESIPAEFLKQLMVGFSPALNTLEESERRVRSHDVFHVVLADVLRYNPPKQSPVVEQKCNKCFVLFVNCIVQGKSFTESKIKGRYFNSVLPLLLVFCNHTVQHSLIEGGVTL